MRLAALALCCCVACGAHTTVEDDDPMTVVMLPDADVIIDGSADEYRAPVLTADRTVTLSEAGAPEIGQRTRVVKPSEDGVLTILPVYAVQSGFSGFVDAIWTEDGWVRSAAGQEPW